MHIDIPKDVEDIIEELENAGYEAYIVGGCVRDSIMGINPKDWDITTSALPQDIKRVFKRTIDTGIKHGTVSVLINKSTYEITTYRIDGEYGDGRHPNSVEFSTSLEEDLKRRDFTINAMAYSHKDGLIDLFGGIRDIKAKRINCVGKAMERFDEDALRMLRAIRFAAVLGFSIEENTFAAICTLADKLRLVSKERVFIELDKTVCSKNAYYIKEVYNSGLYKYISQNFNAVKENSSLDMLYIKGIESKRHIAWTVFMKDIDASLAKAILKELKVDKDTFTKVFVLTSYVKVKLPDNEISIRKLLSKIGFERFRDLIYIKRLLLEKFEESKEVLKAIEEKLDYIQMQGQAISIAMLDIKGDDLMKLGIKKGPVIGKILDDLLLSVLERPELNSKEVLLNMVKLEDYAEN